MKLRFSPGFSFSPLLALVPGGMVLAAFSADGDVNALQLMISGFVLAAGAAWAGMKSSREISQPTPKVDTKLASAILDALPDPVLLLDKSRRIIAANQAANDLLGDNIHDVDVVLVIRHPDAHAAILKVTGGHSQRELANFRQDVPMPRNYDLQVAALPMAEARTVRTVVELHDVTSLMRAEDMRSEFVANVSHELRSPLSTLVGFIETLQTTAKDDAEAQERFLNIMDGEAQRMRRLIDDLLSLSRIESEQHMRPSAKVDLNALLARAGETLRVQAEAAEMRLTLDVAESLPSIRADADQLLEVLQNLVENAMKYGDPGSEISVKATQSDDGHVRLSVHNFGPEIPAEHLPRLTERFYRVDKARSRESGGTGLGLAIVKHILVRHRATLQVDSSQTSGTTFTIRLPVGA